MLWGKDTPLIACSLQCGNQFFVWRAHRESSAKSGSGDSNVRVAVQLANCMPIVMPCALQANQAADFVSPCNSPGTSVF